MPDGSSIRLSPYDDGLTTCFVCGCTDEAACDGGCTWVSDAEAAIDMEDVCSECAALRDLLLLVAGEYDGPPVSLQELAAWSADHREDARAWAAAKYLRASDNIVRVPPRPPFLEARIAPTTVGGSDR